jgi:PAS domain S-box-containing protein
MNKRDLTNINYDNFFYNSQLSKIIIELETDIIINVNRSFIDKFKYEEKYLINKSFVKFNFISNHMKNDIIKEIKNNKNILNKEVDIKTKDGTILNCLFSCDVVRIDSVDYLFIIINDITNIKELQKEILESREKFKNIFNESPVGILLYDEECNLKDINKAGLSIFSKKNIKEMKNFNVFTVDCKSDIKKIIDETNYYENDLEIDVKNVIGNSKGSKKMIFKIIVVKYKFNGSSYMVMLDDITEQKFSYIKVKEEQEKLQNIIEKSPLGIEIYDINGNLVTNNKASTDILGIVDDKKILQFNLFKNPFLPVDLFYHLEKNKKWDGNVEYDFDVVVKEKFYNTNNKGKKYINVVITKQNISKDATYIVQFNDVTEDIEQKNRLLLLNKNKDKLFSVISHDLKNPFNSILGFVDVLYDEYFSYNDEERIHFIKNIKDASYNAFDLLRNLLDWSVTQTNKVNYVPTSVYFNVVVNDVMRILTIQAMMKNIKIYSSIKYGATVHADENILKIILRNLLSNAIKFTRDGGEIYINSEIVIINDNEYVQVSVKDNGIGIDEKNISKLFTIEDTITTMGTNKEKGTGLGLVICKEYVDVIGGNIWVESKINVGSTFYFTIPTC